MGRFFAKIAAKIMNSFEKKRSLTVKSAMLVGMTAGALFTLPINSKTRTATDKVSESTVYKTIPFKNPLKEAGSIEALIDKMTIEEKIGQLQMLAGKIEGDSPDEHFTAARTGKLGSTLNVRGAENVNKLQKVALEESRLGIPILYAFDVIHGHRTIFPLPLAESSSWNLDLIEKASEVAAKEAASTGLRLTFAPMADISFDPRWGRIVEGAGEDPYLAAEISRTRVLGFQGDDPSHPERVGATVKHWIGYGEAEAGRDYNTTDISMYKLRDVFFKPFKAALDAGAVSVMTAFNSLNGIPASAHPLTIDVLRGEWGFDGAIMSDWESVKELIAHGMAKDLKEAATYALNTGLDIEMVSYAYQNHLKELIAEKVVSEAQLDEAVRRVLELKEKLGVFEAPYLDPAREPKTLLAKEHLQLAHQLSKESIVLLKNEGGLLPLKAEKIKNLAVIGPFADDPQEPLGSWNGDGKKEDTVTLLQALKQNFSSKIEIEFEKGVSFLGEEKEKTNDLNGIERAVALAKKSDIILMTLGDPAQQSGEAASKTNIGMPGRQLELLKAVQATGKPVVLVLMNGRPLTIPWEAENIPAILETWLLGTMSGPAIVDVLFGDENPSGKLPVTFPRSVGQIPIYYRAMNTGRPETVKNPKYKSIYLDSPNSPQYAFGHGLSYSKFELKNLKVRTENNRVSTIDKMKVKVDVDLKNFGPYDGKQVIQVYVQDLASSHTRPVKELVAFKKVFLKNGQMKKVSLEFNGEALGFHDWRGKKIYEAGEYKVFVGLSSETSLTGDFELK